MAVHFTLSYNEGYNYTNLFPRTDVRYIVDNQNLLKYSNLNIKIPASNEVVQTISFTPTEKQKNSIFYVKLNSIGTQAESDYSTISNIKINGNNLIITRLFKKPQNEIEINLTFLEGGV